MPDAVTVTSEHIGFIKWLGGLLFSATGILIGLVYNKHEKDFDKLEARVDKMEDGKADKADTDKRLDKGADKFDEVLLEMRGMRQDLQVLSTHIASELALRPTRDEVRGMLQQNQGRP